MKIKRFFSQDMRNVIRMVREELGPDAVILSNNRVNGGIELIAAVDYDESLLETGNILTKSDSGIANSSSDKKTEHIKGTQTNESSGISFEVDKQSELRRELQLELSQGIAQVNQSNSKFPKPSSSSQPKKKRLPDPVNRSEILDVQSVTDAFSDVKDEESVNVNFNSNRTKLFQSDVYKGQSESMFYSLDEQSTGSERISDSLYDTTRTKPSADRKNDQQNQGNIWSQEPTLVAMRNEIGSLRGMLEQQFTSLAWGNTERQNPIRAKLIRQLLELDLSTAVASKIADSIDEDTDYQNAWQQALTYITDNLPVNDEDMVVSGGVVALVGPTGVGKTTTLAKLASRYALRNGRNSVGIVTIDNYRVGAHEQLKTYAKIFDIPMRVATTRSSLVDCINSMSDRNLVLIDTAGMSHKDIRLANQFTLLDECVPNLKTLLVMSSTTHRLGLDETIRSFSKSKIDGCVMTKLDETTNLGGTLSVLLKHNLPITYYCDGQKMPEALHIATAHSLVNRSVLIARKVNQPLGTEAVELAFTGKRPNEYV